MRQTAITTSRGRRARGAVEIDVLHFLVDRHRDVPRHRGARVASLDADEVKLDPVDRGHGAALERGFSTKARAWLDDARHEKEL